MDIWIQLAILIVTSLISYAMQPKPPKNRPPSIDDFDIPTAEEGRPLPVVFGTVTITGPNVCWYGDYEVETQTRDGVKTRKYYMGFHFGLCHGPVDALLKIEVGKKIAWAGEQTASGTITINKGNMFGGSKQGGGIVGDLDVMMGEAAQTANAYLSGVQGTPQPAYRGLLGCVFNKGQVSANSTYLEPWAFQVKRALEGWYNDDVWYSERAIVASVPPTATYDEYVDALNLSHWWKCEFDGGTTDANVGAGATGLTKPSGSTYVATGAASITKNTYDALGVSATCILSPIPQAVTFNAADSSTKYLAAGFAITGAFTMGVWLRPDSYTTAFGVFQTGFQSVSQNYRGVWLRVFSDGRVGLIFGNDGGVIGGSRANYNSSLPLVTGNPDVLFVVLTCNASSTVAGLDFSVYINGDGYTKAIDFVLESGTASTIAWGGGSVIFGRNITYWGATEYVGDVDEPFLHFGTLTDDQIAEMWALGSVASTSGPGDLMNPAHIVYEAVTSPAWGMGLPASMIDLVQLEYAADVFASECFGLAFQWLQQEPIENLIQLVCDHAGCVFTQDPSTGKFLLIPIRDDYTVGSLPVFDESNCILESFERAGYGELVGEVNVVFRDWETNTDATTPPQHNLATIQSQSGVVSETVQYPAIATMGLANRVAARDLAARSVPLSRGKIRCNREAWDLTPGDVFKLTWAKLGITQLVCRVASVDYGTLTDGAISVEWVEDVFALPDASYAGEQSSGWTEPDTDPAAAAAQQAIELPYAWLVGSLDTYAASLLPVGAGYGFALGAKASGLISDDFELWSSLNAGAYAQVDDSIDWTPSTTLGAAVARSDSTLTLTAAFTAAEVGDLLMVGSGATAEIMKVTSNVATAALGVSRGIWDTTPQEHASGARIWVLPDIALSDATQYTDADVVAYKLLTIASGGTLDIAAAAAVSVTMDSRQVRPLPPGNIELNGVEYADAERFPDILTESITVTWSHRDRLTQGTAAVTQETAADYGPEAGTTYGVYLYRADTDALLASETGITGTTCTIDSTETETYSARIEIAGARDGYECWQRQVREFTHVVTGILADDPYGFIERDDDRKYLNRG